MKKEISKEKKEQLKRMSEKRWKNLHPLERVEEVAREKVERLFKEIGLSLERTVFHIRYLNKDGTSGVVEDRPDFEVTLEKAVEVLRRLEPQWLIIDCVEQKLLEVTDDMGDVIVIEKEGSRFFVETRKERIRRG